MKNRKKEEKEAKKKKRLDEIVLDEETSMEERQQDRKDKRKIRRRRFFTLLLILLLLAAMAGGVWYASSKGWLDVRNIVVSGNVRYNTLEIVEMAEAETGVEILKVNKGEMRDKLLQAPYIKAVRISKWLPDTLKITIVEREDAFAASIAGYYVMIDDEQVALRKSNESEGFLVIEGFVPDQIKLGQPYKVENQIYFDDAVRLAAAMKNAEISAQKISFDNGMINIYFTDNLVCKTTYESVINHLDALKVILADLASKNVERGTIHMGTNGIFSYSPLIP